MSYEIQPCQEICNIIGKKKVIVETLEVNNGYITVNNFYVPLSNIIYVKNLG